tara:strand:+ start:1922 stop:2296 length:375 start_codon:yes stop_codon:yes gene_type:complete
MGNGKYFLEMFYFILIGCLLSSCVVDTEGPIDDFESIALIEAQVAEKSYSLNKGELGNIDETSISSNFFFAVNEYWLSTTTIAEDAYSYGSFAELSDLTSEQLSSIYGALLLTELPKGSDFEKL